MKQPETLEQIRRDEFANALSITVADFRRLGLSAEYIALLLEAKAAEIRELNE